MRVLVPVYTSLSLFLLTAHFGSCNSGMGNDTVSTGNQAELMISFYNVENLFDTVNDPLKVDEDFTPTGKLQWNTARYQKKLDDLTKVIMFMNGGVGPDVIGLCEVENRKVLEDLTLQLASQGRIYTIVHKDSPDERGIDVALLFDYYKFSFEGADWLTVDLDDERDPNTRDILKATLKTGNEQFTFYVNHWPSRSGGQAESEPKRMKASSVLKTSIAETSVVNPDAQIICMGDFNDHPTDASLLALEAIDSSNGKLAMTNCMKQLHLSGQGSYNYKGEWGALDQFVVNSAMQEKEGLYVDPAAAFILKEEWMLFKKDDGTLIPNRTYAGPNYTEGYSDHLPVCLPIFRK
ncbi:MAG: hypothetical protein RL220_964 [Bacteroidota bacterium]